MKTCTKCNIEKALSEFGKRSGKQSHLYKSWCKQCYSEKNAQRLKERYDEEPGFKEKLKQYRESNPEKVAEWKQNDYDKNRDAYIRRANAWRDANRPVVRQTKRRYKLKRQEWELNGSFTTAEWVELCERYDNKCLSCGATDAMLTQDHVVPLSRGGSNTIDNIQPLCGSCNSKKHAKTVDYRSNHIANSNSR